MVYERGTKPKRYKGEKMKTEIQNQLHQLALKRSTPFCYSCYKAAPSGCCKICGSDDLMRFIEGVGCEYGTDWVIKHILKTELTTVDLEDSFEQSVRDCYPETTKVGWCEFDTVTLLKEQDPVSWQCALAEYESQEADEENVISFDGRMTYYSVGDLESLIV